MKGGAMSYEELSVCDGKYKLVYNSADGDFKCLRHGEEWQSLTGNKMVYALFCELLECRAAKTAESAPTSTNTGMAASEQAQIAAQMEEHILELERCDRFHTASKLEAWARQLRHA
jgi:hypothetical protein